MPKLGKSPFDDASGQQLLTFLSEEGIGFQPVNAGISAAGTTIADATQLQHGTNNVETVAASTGVILPNVPYGTAIIVANSGANALKVYPPDSAQIIGIAGTPGAANSLASHAARLYLKISALTWAILS